MTGRPDEQAAALDEAGAASRQLVQVLDNLAENPTPEERRALLAQWATLLGQIEEARQQVDRPGAT